LLTLTAYWFAGYLDGRRLPLLAASGAALGLAVLTREIFWPIVAVMALLVGHGKPGVSTWAWHSAALLLSFLAVTTPWVIRNTGLQGTFTLIATNGGPVFYAGNYEHTPPDRPWRSHALSPELKVRRFLPANLTEGERQGLAFRKGLEFIRDHRWLSVRRAVIKAANVWGLERAVVGVLLKGGYGHPGRATILTITALIFGFSALTILGGMTGLCFSLFTPGRQMPFHLYFSALIVISTLIPALTSGHPRYHLPLMPFFSVYAAHAWTIRQDVWNGRRSRPFKVAAVVAGLLFAIWTREIFFVEFQRFIQAL